MFEEFKGKINNLRENNEEATNFFLKKLAYIVKPTELKNLLDQENIKIIDVRDREEYKTGHIPLAISVPLKEIEADFEKCKTNFDSNKLHIIYCHCPLCDLALKAAIMLSHNKYKVAILQGGYKAWAETLSYATEVSEQD